jgi:hypothetical protein
VSARSARLESVRAHRRLIIRSAAGLAALWLGCAACADSAAPGTGAAGSSQTASLKGTGSPGSSGSIGAATSELRVNVLQAPTCPVERADSPCPPGPVPSARITVLRGSSVVARLGTDVHGRCVVRVAPGHYVVQAARVTGLFGRAHKDVDVGGAPASVTLVLDSGIR